jgi:hypothetical protein
MSVTTRTVDSDNKARAALQGVFWATCASAGFERQPLPSHLGRLKAIPDLGSSLPSQAAHGAGAGNLVSPPRDHLCGGEAGGSPARSGPGVRTPAATQC